LRAAGVLQVPVVQATVRWPKTVEGMAPAAFVRTLRGCRFTAVERRAKYLLLRLEDGRTLVVHLRMTGNLRVTAKEPPAPHDRVLVDFENGLRLHFRDPRKFGRWRLCRDLEWLEARLGLEPLGPAFTPRVFHVALLRRKRKLKPLLLDQSFIAGLGNIYADEALFAAGLHPCRLSDSLSPDEARALHRAIRCELRRSIRNQGTSLGEGVGNYAFASGRRGRHQLHLRVYQRTGAACVQCGNPVQRIVVAQRATHYCPVCQPLKPVGARKAGS
jgi:formamidopyrimidine-DNA glycosylase